MGLLIERRTSRRCSPVPGVQQEPVIQAVTFATWSGRQTASAVNQPTSTPWALPASSRGEHACCQLGFGRELDIWTDDRERCPGAGIGAEDTGR